MALSRRDVFPSMPSIWQADAALFVRRIPTPPLVRAPGDILRFRAHAPTELGVFVEVPLVTTLKCWSWFAGAFSRPCAVP